MPAASRRVTAPFGYSADVERQCAAFDKHTGRIINLLTVQAILDEEQAQTI